MVIRQFEIYLVSLDPTQGSEIKKTRPCMVISPNEVNQNLHTVIIVPLTSTRRSYPTRVDCVFEHKNGQLAIDQLRSVDRSRLVKRLGVFKDETVISEVIAVLNNLFSL